LTADEQKVDSALRIQHRTHADQDAALTLFRLAHRASSDVRSERLERVADLLVGKELR
jgi:hypothetical protein